MGGPYGSKGLVTVVLSPSTATATAEDEVRGSREVLGTDVVGIDEMPTPERAPTSKRGLLNISDEGILHIEGDGKVVPNGWLLSGVGGANSVDVPG